MKNLYKRVILLLLLLLIFGFAFFLRVFFVYNIVFSNPIKYSADDGVYHMRLVENELLGNHFPHIIKFDPYTYFPYGAYKNIVPLFDQILAAIIWLISFGNPTKEIIDKTAPFYPALMGSLLVFIVYFIAKKIWDKKTAFLSSFLMAISIPYLQRSLLGAVDNHVAEVFFSSLAMMFLFFSLKERKNKDIKLQKSGWNSIFTLLKNEIAEEKKFWIFIIFAGFSLGLYFLAWSGALLFLFLLFVFIISYYLIGYFFKNPPYWILLAGIAVFFVALVTILPFLDWGKDFYAIGYNFQYVSSMIIGILVFIILGAMGYIINRKTTNRWFFGVIMILIAGLILITMRFFFPLSLRYLMQTFMAVSNSMTDESVKKITSEMTPLGLFGLFNFFHSLVLFSFIGLSFIIYKFIKKRKPEDFLIIVWTLILLIICGVIPFFGQLRFVYYLSVNISLLAGFLMVKGIRFGWMGLSFYKEFPKNSYIKNYILAGSVVIIFSIILFLFYPFPFNLDNGFPANLPTIFQAVLSISKDGIIIQNEDWYKSLEWLKENTPDPMVDYYGLYKGPGLDINTYKINSYSYPEESYGVLARWDVGHMITYYAQRMPNASNSQYGIGKKEENKIIKMGETVFFTETNEDKSIAYLQELKTRYIITDYQSAYPDGIFKTKLIAMQGNYDNYLETKGSKEPSMFDNSMIARLHILDGRETITKRNIDGKESSFYIKPLDHFCLIYESPTTVSLSSQDLSNEIKAIKIFEFVKGAKISGSAKDGEIISISTEVKTNQGREFVYEKKTGAENGKFEFIVPYSTFGEKGIIIGQTKFEVFASPYKLKIGDKEIEINVLERDVLEGKEIKIK